MDWSPGATADLPPDYQTINSPGWHRCAFNHDNTSIEITRVFSRHASCRLCYYYAHLERYAGGLHEGQTVSRGQVIGYVGTSGNAPPDTPHLHFAVNQLNADRHWWQGRALDPYEVFRR